MKIWPDRLTIGAQEINVADLAGSGARVTTARELMLKGPAESASFALSTLENCASCLVGHSRDHKVEAGSYGSASLYQLSPHQYK